MAKIAITMLLLWSFAGGDSTKPSDMIGSIDFFGYAGLDVAKVRAVLPVHVGDAFTKETKNQVNHAVVEVLGKEPTDVAVVCCNVKGMSLLYVGLPGGSYKSFALNPAPSGAARLPEQIVKLNERASDAIDAAVERGMAVEDDSNGYVLLTKDPKGRALELQERQWALAHGPELLKVLRSSADAGQREVASEVLGYARQSHEQIVVLEYAMRDPDSDVRNNAVRALAVLVRSNAKLTVEIDPDPILEMLGSGRWTDLNKAVLLLEAMTQGRDPRLLAKIRARGIEPLIEMARWSEWGHAAGARMILGRVGGIPEDKLSDLVLNGPVETIVATARKD